MVVRCTQSVRDLAGDLKRVIQGQPLLVVQAVTERLACDIRHHVIQEARRFAGVVKRQDVGMREACRNLDFPQKPVAAEQSGKVGLQNLDRHPAVVLDVVGEIDRRHPPPADFRPDGVPVRECGFQLIEDMRRTSHVGAAFFGRRGDGYEFRHPLLVEGLEEVARVFIGGE
jgi:hypothetical protein